MNTMLNYLDNMLCLFYPSLCLACERKDVSRKQILCIKCEDKLPRTNFHQFKENEFTQRFWGRIPLETASSLYIFEKENKTQKLIHNLKYEGKQKVGILVGQVLGDLLKKSPNYQDIDLIVPIPLHRKKERQRGFNQSDVFAQGLSEGMEIPWQRDNLIRTKYTSSQTNKSRKERFENVMQAFHILYPEKLEGKHVLLVDDVLTTGATLEAGAVKILEVPNTKISFATIAFAKN